MKERTLLFPGRTTRLTLLRLFRGVLINPVGCRIEEVGTAREM